MTATVKVFKQCIVKDWQSKSKTNILIFIKVALRFALSTCTPQQQLSEHYDNVNTATFTH